MRRYLAGKRTAKERTAKAANTMMTVRRIFKLWTKYKSNIHKSIASGAARYNIFLKAKLFLNFCLSIPDGSNYEPCNVRIVHDVSLVVVSFMFIKQLHAIK